LIRYSLPGKPVSNPQFLERWGRKSLKNYICNEDLPLPHNHCTSELSSYDWSDLLLPFLKTARF